MTGNQIRYASLLEDTRHNKINEEISRAQAEAQKSQARNQRVANAISAFTNATSVDRGIDTILQWFNVNGASK